VVVVRVRSVSILAALFVAVAVPGAAQAAPPSENIHYENVDAGSTNACGFTMNFERTDSGHLMVREVEDSGSQTFLVHDNFKFRDVLTNPETGAFIVVRGHGLFREFTARHIGGDVWEFTAHEVGQPFVVEDSEGNIVLRDRGRVTFRAVIDTLGDSQPGGILLEEEITGVHGPHPGLVPDICAIITDLIG
jgi:hypothetical protein